MIDKLRELVPLNIQENVSLSLHTTFRIGGPAKFFVEVNNKADLYKCLNATKQLALPYIILGGGSNILCSDQGFDGLVIKLLEGPIEFKANEVTVFAGNNLMSFVNQSVIHNLFGLEFAGNIPGTVGGGVRGNAGAYGQALGDFALSVEVLEPSNNEVVLKLLDKEECHFSYREAIFKKQEQWVVAEITFKLNSEGDKEVSLKKIADEHAERVAKQPYEFPSAGCIFKNIEYNPAEMSRHERYVSNGKIVAARLIEESGMKGKKLGGAQVSEKHANFIINNGKATASEVIQLISMVKMRVRDEQGLQLMEEVQYIGF